MVVEELIAKLGLKVGNLSDARKFIKTLEDVKKAATGLGKGIKVNLTGNASGIGRIARDFDRAAASARRFRLELERANRVRAPRGGRYGPGGGVVPGYYPGGGYGPGRRPGGSGKGPLREAGGAALDGTGYGIGRAGAVAATAYLGGRVASRATRSSMDFERAMIEVGKATDSSGKELEGYGEKVMALARETGQNKEGLAGMLASAGFAGRPKEDLIDFVRFGAKATKAWGASPEDTGQAMAEIGNIYTANQKEIERIGDQINTMADKSASRESDLLEILRRVGGTAKTSGLSSGDLLAFGAGLKERGVQTEVASSGIESYLNFLKLGEEYSSNADDALKKLGLTSKKLRADFVKSPMDTAIQFLEKLNAVKDPLKRAEILTGAFGKERQDDVERMMGSVDKIKQYRELMQNPANYRNSVNEQFAEQMKAEVSRIDQATQTLDTLAKSAGDYGKAAIAAASDLLNAAYKRATANGEAEGRSPDEVMNRLREANGLRRVGDREAFERAFQTGGPTARSEASLLSRNGNRIPRLTRQPKGAPSIEFPRSGTSAPTFGGAFGLSAGKDWMRQGVQQTTTNNVTNNTNTGNDQRTQSVTVNQTVNGVPGVAQAAASGAKSALSSMGPSIVKGGSAATGADTAP